METTKQSGRPLGNPRRWLAAILGVVFVLASGEGALAQTRASAWGYGGYNLLGHGNQITIGDDETPAAAGDVPTDASVVQVSQALDFACVLFKAGNVRCFGYGMFAGYGGLTYTSPNVAPDLNLGAAAVQITSGEYHTCALLVGGTVKCWGVNGTGKLGTGNTNNITLATLAPAVTVGGTVVQIEAGREHTCALLDTGKVRCWGSGANGRLGYGNQNNIR